MSPAGLMTLCFFFLVAALPRAGGAPILTVNTKSTGRTLTGTAFGVNLFYWGDNHASLP